MSTVESNDMYDSNDVDLNEKYELKSILYLILLQAIYIIHYSITIYFTVVINLFFMILILIVQMFLHPYLQSQKQRQVHLH